MIADANQSSCHVGSPAELMDGVFDSAQDAEVVSTFRAECCNTDDSIRSTVQEVEV